MRYMDDRYSRARYLCATYLVVDSVIYSFDRDGDLIFAKSSSFVSSIYVYAGGDQEIIELSNLYIALHYLVSTRYEKQKSIFIV